MNTRLRVLLQGVGVLALVFAVAAGATYAVNRIQSSSGTGYEKRVAVVSGSRPTPDVRTGVVAQIDEAIVVTGGQPGSTPPRGQEWLLVRVTLTDGGPAARVDPANFYAVDPSGQGFGTTVKLPGYRSLSAAPLHTLQILTRWIGFQIPRTAGEYQVVWNDNNHLVPPTQLARIRV